MTAMASINPGARAGEPAADSTVRTAGHAGEPGGAAPAGQVRFAFYGRTARNDAGDAAAARHWQAERCRAAAAACGGQVTAWFFDTACPSDRPWPSRPQGRALLAALADPHRGVDAVVAADAARLLPRRPAGAGTGIPGWLAGWHAPLLLADTGITISSAEEYDLMADILLGLGRLPGRGQAAPAAITRRVEARRAEPPSRGRPAARRRSSPLPPPGLPGAGTTGRPQ